jgi:hypothetical protein
VSQTKFKKICALMLGVIAFMTQISAQAIPKDFEHLMLEIIVQPARGNPTGSRVFRDGRYEFLSDSEIIVAKDGSSTRKTVELKWREVFVFTPNELAQLERAIQDANIPSLNAVYAPSGQTSNTSTMTWRVLLNAQVKQIVVQGYPETKVPALDTLYKRFNQIHQYPKASSVWQVWTKTGVVRRTFECDVSSVDFLRPVLQALFIPSETSSNNGTVSLEPQTQILEIAWREAGVEVERTRLYADGRYVEVGKNSESLVKTLSAVQVNAFLEQLHNIDWNRLPEPACQDATGK